MTETKFDVGDKVLVTGTVEAIYIGADGIHYEITVAGASNTRIVDVAESKLMLKQKGKHNGNKTR